MTKTRLIVALLWFCALGLAGWTLTQLPLGGMAAQLTQLTLLDYFLWTAVNIAVILLLNQRWWLIARALGARVKFAELLLVKQAGQSISFITPGPQIGGEPLQVFWLWRRSQVPLHKALLSLGLDRIFEVLINFAVLMLCLGLLLTTSASQSAEWGVIFFALFMAAIFLLISAKIFLGRPAWLANKLNTLVHQWHNHPHLRSITTQWNLLREDFRHCIDRSKMTLVNAALLSIAAWIAMFIELALIFWMADISLDLTGFLLFFVAMRLALLLPLPGGIGTMEAAVFWSFHYLALPAQTALMVIALIRLRDAIILVVGLLCAVILQKSSAQKTSPQTPSPENVKADEIETAN